MGCLLEGFQKLDYGQNLLAMGILSADEFHYYLAQGDVREVEESPSPRTASGGHQTVPRSPGTLRFFFQDHPESL
jgi:hypothetical protein